MSARRQAGSICMAGSCSGVRARVCSVRPAVCAADGGGRSQAHEHEHDAADHEEQDREVQEIDVAYQPSSPSPSAARLSSSTRRARPSTKPVDERRHRAGRVDPLPEDAEEEHGGDRRRDVGLHALQVLVELAGDQLHQRNPQRARSPTMHDRRDLPDQHELALARLRARASVDVQGHERRAGIEDRRERAHERREQAGDDETAQARREQRADERRQRLVRARRARAAPRLVRARRR